MTAPFSKLRPFYWLALFQLVAGPLVLVQVMVFCKMTARELPQQSVTEAMHRAWDSREFQTALAASSNDVLLGVKSKSSSPTKPEPKVKKDGAKLSMIALLDVPVVLTAAPKAMQRMCYAKSWTPAWSQAPPGPPPRVG